MIYRSVLSLSLLSLANGVDSAVDVKSQEAPVSADFKDTLNAAHDPTLLEAVMANDHNKTASDGEGNLSEELYFGLDFGVPQTLYDDFEEQQVAHIKKTRAYLQQEIWIHGPNMCSNKVEECSYYTVAGECERSAQFMVENCAPMCRKCHINPHHEAMSAPPVDPNCPVDYSTNAWGPGDLNKMFERIVSDPAMQVYEPKVLSRPTLALGDTNETAEYIVGGPWIVVFDKMVTGEEADHLIELGEIQGYKRSMDAVGFNPDGSAAQFVSPQRTSTNAWCINECSADPKARVVSDRISEITHIPESFAENLQLLHYTEGQFCMFYARGISPIPD